MGIKVGERHDEGILFVIKQLTANLPEWERRANDFKLVTKRLVMPLIKNRGVRIN